MHTLCDIYAHIAQCDGHDLIVNFHFDYEDDNVRIRSVRARHAEVTVLVKKPLRVRLRIPGRAEQESVKVLVNGTEIRPLLIGPFAYLPSGTAPAEIVLKFDLPIHTHCETTKGTQYRFAWKGDEITGVYPNDEFLPYYPTIESDK